jgi:hypothetical protein
MPEILALLFNKYTLGALAIALVLFAAFEKGKADGHDAGYQQAWNVQQTTINKMTADETAQIQEANNKLSQLELSAMTSYAQAQQAQQAASKKRTQIVTVYKQANPQIANSCGWSIPTVQAIDQLIDVGQ